jgi:hypothetical protein
MHPLIKIQIVGNDNGKQILKLSHRGYYLTQMKNSDHSALGSLAHSAELKGKIEKAQLFHLLL